MKRVLNRKILLAILVVLPLFMSSVSAETLSWVEFWGGEGFDVAGNIALDNLGNVYITGVKQPGPFGGYDAFVASYDPSGVLRWEAFWGTRAGYEVAGGIAIDDFGNVYIAGITSPGPFGVFDLFVVSFNSTGSFQWVTLWGTPGYEWGGAIAVDSSGNIFVAGRTSEVYYPGPYDAFVVSFDSSGGYRWEAFWGTPIGYDRADAVAVDSFGNVYIGGRTGVGEIFGQPFEAFLCSYDNYGNLQWEIYWGKIACDFVYGITFDSSGNIYIAGVVYIFGPFGADDAFVASFDRSGALRWEAFWGTAGNEVARGVTVGPLGNIYLAGYITPGPHGGTDALLVSFNSTGGLNWNATWGTEGLDQAVGVAVDYYGDVYIAGFTYPGPLGHYDGFVAAFAASPITATVDIDPDTLNLASNSKWVTGYIEFPEGYDLEDIDINTISIDNTITVDPSAPAEIGDHDIDGIPDLMVKFDRASMLASLGTSDFASETGKSYQATCKIAGKARGFSFEGFDTVRVLSKG